MTFLAWYVWTERRARARHTADRRRGLDALAVALGLARDGEVLRGVVDGHAVEYDGARLRVAFVRPLAPAELAAAATLDSSDARIAAAGIEAWCYRPESSVLTPLIHRIVTLARTIESSAPRGRLG